MKFTSMSAVQDPSAISSGVGSAVMEGANPPGSDLVGQTWYECDYCGSHSATTSGISNGRTRIRCDCGGTNQDGVRRLHQR